MLEIIFLWLLGRNLANRVKAKGRAPARYVVILVVLWFIGEIGGWIAGSVAAQVINPRNEDADLIFALGGAIAGAVTGALISFAIVGSLKDQRQVDWLERTDNYADDMDFEDRPRRHFDDPDRDEREK